MKIQILTNNIKNRDVMLQGLQKAKDWASTIGLNFEYSFKDTTKAFTTQSYTTTSTFTYVNPQEILDEADTTNKIVCLLHNVQGTTNPFQHPILKNNCNPIQIPENWWVTFPEVLCAYFLHEICHSGYYFANNVTGDRTHYQGTTIGWENKQAYEYYLWLLQGLKQYLETTSPVTYPLLRIRSTNKIAVRELQTLLGGLIIDGDFGNKTLQAVIAFQKSKGLSADGVVGNKTWTELKKKL